MIAPHDVELRAWIRRRVQAHPYWFHRIEIFDDLVTPGWSDPEIDKLPYYGLPERLDGMRVLDVGCAEGFFSFEAERRGAAEVVAVDSYSGSVERFGIVRDALGSKISVYLCNVYDLSPRTLGTFDLVMFFGVLYHLRHPLYALEKLAGICCGSLLLQTAVMENPQTHDDSLARFHPFGMESGPPDDPRFDPTVFWMPTPECTKNMLRAVGFDRVEDVTNVPGLPFAVRAGVKEPAAPVRPDPMNAPWS